MPIRPASLRRLPIALCAAAMAAAACGPITIDVATLPSAKPSGGATAGPGSTPPSIFATPAPDPARKSPTPAKSPTPGPGGARTPGPNDTGDPNATPGPNDTPRPAGPTPTASATISPDVTRTPGSGGTPRPWPSAVELPGGTPVQGEVYAITRDAGKPTDVAVDAGGVAWITLGQFNTSGEPPKGELVRMGADGTPLQVLTLEGNPKRVEAASGGGVWVLMDVKSASGGMVTSSVLRLSAESKVLSRLDLGYGGGSSGGNEGLRLVPDAGGNLWVKNGNSWSANQIYRIAPGGGLLGTYNAGSSTSSYGGLGVDSDGHGWLTDSSSKQVVRIAPNMTRAAEHATASSDGYGAFEVACSGDRVWLNFSKEIAVWKLDGTRDFGIPTGYPVLQMRAAGDGGMWALTSTGGFQSHGASVVRFDKAGTATASYAVGADVRGFGVGGDGAIWAVNHAESTVTRVATR